jgi:predicted transcriptional regulator
VRVVFLTVEPSGKWSYAGPLAPYLFDTLKLVKCAGRLTVGQLAEERQLRTSAASNRLNRLHRLRLVRREGVTTPNGLGHVYHFWQWAK